MIHLHNHTSGSNVRYYDSIIRPEILVKKAKELGHPAIAITDHASLSSVPDFHSACIKHEIKPIIGSEIYLTRDGLTGQTHEGGEKFLHLVLLAKNRTGYRALNEIQTLAAQHSYTKNIKRMPTYMSHLVAIMRKFKGHLIATTACLGGLIGKDVLGYFKSPNTDALNNIQNKLLFFKDLFGEDCFFLELQPALYKEQIKYNEFLVELSQRLDIPLTVACDAHYVEKEDFDLHHTFLNSQNQNAKVRETEDFYRYTYLMNDEETLNNLIEGNISRDTALQAMSNTDRIAASVEEYSLKMENNYLMETTHRDPNWETILKEKKDMLGIPMCEVFYNSPYEIDRYFLYQVLINFEQKVEKGWITKVDRAIERIEEELDTFWQISGTINERLARYFQTMKEMLAIVWKISIVGVGRGSAGGSLICFLFDITSLNPLEVYDQEKQELPFWRFLHPDRPELADIDVDSSSAKKEEIINALAEWASTQNHVLAKVATRGTLKSKQALQIAARGLGYESEDILYFSSLVPVVRGFPMGLEECSENPSFLGEFVGSEKVLEIAKQLEGLVVSSGEHAAAVCFFNQDDMFERCSFSMSKSGVLTTEYDLGELEKLNIAVKFDMLSTKAIDVLINSVLLLCEEGYMDWQGDLKSTYDQYLHPSMINHRDPKIWEMINRNEIIGLFQFDTQVGAQGIKIGQPQSLYELSDINSVIRLMPPEDEEGRKGELPLITYSRHKSNSSIWDLQMKHKGLTEEEIGIVKEHLKLSYGITITQELVMMLTMDKRIAGFSMNDANACRKAIAKKKIDLMEKVKSLFFEKGRALQTSENLLNYVWYDCIMLSAGYGFSLLHSTLYSFIALQQAYLNTFFPTIIYSAARLLVDSQSAAFLSEQLTFLDEEDEEEEKELQSKNVNYFKLASALNQTRQAGIDIRLPSLNKSAFTFKPSVDENAIYFGLKGITRISDTIIQNIIANRPYIGWQDLLKKVKLNVLQVSNLIKAGALDEFGDRRTILAEYCKSIADTKSRLTLQNAAKLIELNLIPQELFQDNIKVFKINKHLRKHFLIEDLFIPEGEIIPYIHELDFDQVEYDEFNSMYFEERRWKRYYDQNMLPIKNYIQKNHDALLKQMNEHAVKEKEGKYMKGTIADWEMDSLSFYYTHHKFEEEEYQKALQKWGVCNFNDLPEEPEIEWQNGEAKKFRLSTIAGVAIGRDKMKNLVGVLTTDGYFNVKVYRSTFNKFDKQIKTAAETEKSWFSKGTMLLLQGYRMDDEFKIKAYKSSSNPMLTRVIGPNEITTKRIEEEEENE